MTTFFFDYELLAKSGLFDSAYYKASNPDVGSLDPLVHYLERGAREGRRPRADFDTAYYLEQCRAFGDAPDNPLLHFVTIGGRRGLKIRRDESATENLNGAPVGSEAENDIILTVDAVRLEAVPTGAGRRLRIEGWAIATSPIAEIAGSIGGITAGFAIYGQRRTDVGRMYPQYPKSDHAGFSIVLDHATDDPRETIEVELVARTEGGEMRRATVPVGGLAQGGAEANGAGIAAAAPTFVTSPPMQLHVDQFGVDALGILRIAGWAVCFVHIDRIHVFLDDEDLGAADFGAARDDVARICPEYPNAGFSGYAFASDVRRFGAGRHVLKVEAVTETGISRQVIAPLLIPDLPKPRESKSAHAFASNCDEILLTTAGELYVSGWAVPPAPVASIAVLFDGQALGEAETDGERADVGNHFPSLAHARRSGFTFRHTIEGPVEGEHLVTLVVRSTDEGTHQVPLPTLARDFAIERPAGAAESEARKISIDHPLLVNGAVSSPVRGNLEISGWALAREGVASVDIAIDGTRVLAADYGLRRMDVAAAFPDWPDALTSGFFAMLPHRLLTPGRHTVAVSIEDTASRSATTVFHLEAEAAPETSGPWSLRRKLPQSEIDLHMQVVARLEPRPRFTLLLEMDEDSSDAARRTLASLQRQAYGEWQLIVTARKPLPEAERDALFGGWLAQEKRVTFADRKSTSLTELAAQETGAGGRTFLSAIVAGDELGCDALLEMAVAATLAPNADFLYSDERRPDPASGEVGAFFKPQWSPDLLLSTNYVGRLWCARIDLLRRVDLVTRDFLDRGDYDVVLRCTEAATSIHHVPKVLCERLEERDDPVRERRALARALSRRGVEGEVEDGCSARHFRVRRTARTDGKVSIIIPTCASRGLIKTCIETIRAKTAYRNFEIVCIENIPDEDRHWKTWLRDNADVVVEADKAFNWARFNNRAAARASGDFFLFLNDDIEIIDGGWLDALLEHAVRPEVGAVGALLLYPDRKIQHAGMFLAQRGQARHAFRYASEAEPGYFGLAQTQRNVAAVTGACLLTRRETFEALGRFEEQHSVINNDLDYCLKSLRAGLVNVFTPYAKLIHHEFASRGDIEESYDIAAFDNDWRDRFLLGDPYYHPRLSIQRDDYGIDWEPVETVHAGHPIAHRESIRSILVVKLDHIGDCVIALPAVRRLKQHFPEAAIHVLSSRSSKSVWSVEPAIDGVIEFNFFHARSSLGRVEHSAEALAALGAHLAAHRFDLAIDLRKSIDTRPILEVADARVTAGFDYKNHFPWLDVALEWEGDPAFAPKRQHVADSLVNLVDAVAAACEPDRTVIATTPPDLPAAALDAIGGKRLFSRPVVVIHPAVGTEMRQWPAESFAALTDTLIERCGVHAVIIGGPDEAAIGEAVLSNLHHRHQAWNAIGAFTLAQLPSLLKRAALFVGNNSGPKHIAAGLGVPTIGIHSGVVDAQEWGPLGPRAIAVQRDMSCGPCYLTTMADCRRGFGCMRGITPGEVFRLCERMLATTPTPRSGARKGSVRKTAPATRRRAREREAAR